MKMKYIKLQNGKIIECADENYQKILLENENSEELSKDDAYAFLFVKISNKMANQFSNYNYIDIASELFYILLRIYKEHGNYAKDKSFDDNARIWWSIARKNCFYIIRRYKAYTRLEDLTDYIPEDAKICETYEIESLATCKTILDYIEQLIDSDKVTEQNMGLYARYKIKGLTDDAIAIALNIGMSRLYEIKRSVKRRLINKFGDLL